MNPPSGFLFWGATQMTQTKGNPPALPRPRFSVPGEMEPRGSFKLGTTGLERYHGFTVGTIMVQGLCDSSGLHEPTTQVHLVGHAPESSDWMQLARDLVGRLRLEQRVQGTEEELQALKMRLTQLEKRCEDSLKAPVCVPISTLAPEPFDVIKNFYVVVQSEEDCYVATLFDANISSSGDSQEEAVANVIDLTVMIFRSLENEDDSKLGPAMVRQKHALQSLIRRS